MTIAALIIGLLIGLLFGFFFQELANFANNKINKRKYPMFSEELNDRIDEMEILREKLRKEIDEIELIDRSKL